MNNTEYTIHITIIRAYIELIKRIRKQVLKNLYQFVSQNSFVDAFLLLLEKLDIHKITNTKLLVICKLMLQQRGGKKN